MFGDETWFTEGIIIFQHGVAHAYDSFMTVTELKELRYKLFEQSL